jgi:hypothetical protein
MTKLTKLEQDVLEKIIARMNKHSEIHTSIHPIYNRYTGENETTIMTQSYKYAILPNDEGYGRLYEIESLEEERVNDKEIKRSKEMRALSSIKNLDFTKAQEKALIKKGAFQLTGETVTYPYNHAILMPVIKPKDNVAIINGEIHAKSGESAQGAIERQKRESGIMSLETEKPYGVTEDGALVHWIENETGIREPRYEHVRTGETTDIVAKDVNITNFSKLSDAKNFAKSIHLKYLKAKYEADLKELLAS